MTRLCFLCGKKIGFRRSLVDQQYCSPAHRREAGLASSQALREEEELEPWSVEKSRNRKKVSGKSYTTPGQTASLLAFFTVAGLLLAALMLPGPGTTYPPSISLDPGTKRGLMDRAGDAISEVIRSSAPVTLHSDFHSSLSDWATMALHSSSNGSSSVDDPRSWITAAAPDIIKPGSLRLWKPSVTLQNYQMEFMGQMEKHSLSWAVRATDQNNYYASKLVITRPGPQPNARLDRYLVLNGRQYDLPATPLNQTLERGVNYRVRVSVEDDHFLTYLNGTLIGNLTDTRLPRGGVGFFADDDDSQEVAWVDVSEHDRGPAADQGSAPPGPPKDEIITS
jgi:hypothetical protein